MEIKQKKSPKNNTFLFFILQCLGAQKGFKYIEKGVFTCVHDASKLRRKEWKFLDSQNPIKPAKLAAFKHSGNDISFTLSW